MAQRRRLTFEDVLAFKSVSDAQIHPDGSKVAFVLGDAFKSSSKWAHANIWLADTQGGEPRQFTRGPRTDALPRWSPDGRWLAFLSDRERENQRQICLVSSDGGEAEILTKVAGAIPSPRGLNSLQWSPDGRSLCFLMEDPENDQVRARREARDDVIEFEKHPRFVRVWKLDLATRALACVSPPGLQIWEFSIHPNSQDLAAVASDFPFEWSWYTNRLVRFTPQQHARTLWQSSRQVSLPTWSPDGSQVACIASNWSDRGCVAGDVFLLPGQGGTEQDLTAGLQASIGWIEWQPHGQQLLALAHERGGIGMFRIPIGGAPRGIWWRQACAAEPFWPRFSRAASGRIAAILESPTEPKDVWLADDQGDSIAWRQLTHLHPQADNLEVGETHVHHWRGADGWEMQGLVIRPVGYEPGKRFPLILWVHGGPTGVSASRYYAALGWLQHMATAGYAVFLPNYRGSVGWGLDFAESNLGDMGGRDFTDMLTGVDSLIASGLADPDRLGVGGWSYGGFASAWAVSQTKRFRVAIMGAGISHWLSFHGRSALSAWDAIHYQADPYEAHGLFHKFSPLSHARNITTPTLILHGEVDEDVPVEQSYLFYRALRDLGVPTELAVYPREAHGVEEYAHQLDMARRVMAWLKEHLPPGA